MPMYVCLVIPNLAAFTGRFLISSIVEDKQTKMRETLRIMGLSRLSYGFSIFLF